MNLVIGGLAPCPLPQTGKRQDTRKNRELTDADIQKISGTYHAWRTVSGEGAEYIRFPSAPGVPAEEPTASGRLGRGKYADVKGFCKAAKLAEVEKSGYVLTPGLYVGTDYVEEDDEVFGEKVARITKELSGQFKQSKNLEERIRKNLKGIGFDP